MPEGKRIIIEKSSTVRRRYQRSDKRFKFTAKQLKQIEREEELDKRAKEIREKEKRRIANKKKRDEQEAKAREELQEARRQGLPDPHAKIPSSQPLLSKFLGFASRPVRTEEPPVEKPLAENTSAEESRVEEIPVDEPILETVFTKTSPEPTTTEPIAHDNDGDTEVDSAAGDTEPDSDGFDDLDEELEYEISALEGVGAAEEWKSPPPVELSNTTNTNNTFDGDDEFSDWSAFDDDEIMKEVEAAAAATKSNHHEVAPPINPAPINPTTVQPPTSHQPKPCSLPTLNESFRDETANFLDKDYSEEDFRTTINQPKPCSLPKLNESFRDETADFLEDVLSRGCGESFGELMQLGQMT